MRQPLDHAPSTFNVLTSISDLRVSRIRTIRIYAANDIREREIKVTKILAEFLTLTMASVEAEEMKPLHKIAAPFIAALASLLKANLDNRSRIVDSLRDPLLTMLGIVSFNLSQQPSDEDVWALALHYGTYNMITAGNRVVLVANGS